MAIIQHREHIAETSASVSDWEGVIHSLVWPAGLSQKDRLILFRRGKKDARHGLVDINEYGELASPYCEALVQSANQRIALEWMRCDSSLYDAQIKIEQIERQVAELNYQLTEATMRKDEALQAVRNRHYDGDDAVSEHLSTRRQLNREKPIHEAFNRESSAINAQLADAELQVIPYRHRQSQAEEAAISHEQLVRVDYLWRLSVYAYGASGYIKVTPDMINDSALSNEPREKHERYFGNAITKNTNQEA